jgi:hypothetical protein
VLPDVPRIVVVAMNTICKACNRANCPDGVEKPEDCEYWIYAREQRKLNRIKRLGRRA